LRSQFRILGNAEAPDIAPGKHCTDPVTCEFYDRCNPPLADDHIGYLPRIQPAKIDELLGMGIESIHDIPDDFPLNERSTACSYRVQTESRGLAQN
jgi:predicted RecB family nuclease